MGAELPSVLPGKVNNYNKGIKTLAMNKLEMGDTFKIKTLAYKNRVISLTIRSLLFLLRSTEPESQASLESLLGSNSGKSGVMDPGEIEILRKKERTRRTQRRMSKEADPSVEEIESPGPTTALMGSIHRVIDRYVAEKTLKTNLNEIF